MSQPDTYKAPSPYPPAGTVIDGKYQVERILGEGGMGAVAKATHLLRRAPVALKFMSPAMAMSDGAIERFLNEGVAASQIDSDHVVKIFDVGKLSFGGSVMVPYLVMELLDGVDLSVLLVRDGRPGLEIPRAVHFILQSLRALQVAHAAGVIHRDMKPSNVFVITKDGEPDFVKLVDFGISKVLQQPGPGGGPALGALTKTNSALGTPLYMSPEQARRPRDVDLRTDIYSVAVILYELLSTKTPFNADSGEYTEILFKIFTMDPPHIKTHCPWLPDGLAEVIHKAMARDPNERYASAAEMAEGLAPWADERSAHVLSRLRGAGRVAQRSHAPPSFMPPPQSVIPPAAGLPSDLATAKTQSGMPAPSIPPAAMPVLVQSTQSEAGGGAAASVAAAAAAAGAAVRTDMAASRDAARVEVERPLPDQGRRTVLAIGFVVLMVLLSLVGGAFMVRSRIQRETGEPDAGAQVATAPTSNGLPPATATGEAATTQPQQAPAPPASVTPPSSAVVVQQAPKPPGSAAPPQTPPGNPPGRPGQLTDIKPAQ